MSLFSIFFVKPQDDYHPRWPQWMRWLGWAARNPFPGLVKPLEKPIQYFQILPNDTISLVSPVPTWNPKGGYWKLSLHDKNGRTKVFRSYRGKLIECYFGWRPNGSFGIAFRHANAKGF